MKICLVPYPVFSDVGSDTIDSDRCNPYLPLGILTLSALLEQAGHTIAIFDPVWEVETGLLEKSALRNHEYVAKLILNAAPDLVGFSTITSSYPLVIKWAESFHNLSPQTPILFGGPQATATDKQTLQAFPWISMILRGEAENSIVSLVTCLQSGGNLASVPGLTWRDGNQIIRNSDAPVVIDLDTLPTPAYHLYPMEKLVRNCFIGSGQNHQPFPLEAGRGCPFHCSYCSTSSFFRRKYRTKSADRLVCEMLELHTRYGIESFLLSHDLFTCNGAYVLEFCQRLREKGLHKKIKWQCSSRIDTIDSKILAEMSDSGCMSIFYGIESGSQRMQRVIGKNLPIQKVRPVVKETLSLGMGVVASFICGFPQERYEDISETLELAMDMIDMGVTKTILYPLTPLPGSDLYREFGNNLFHDGQWSDIFFGHLCQDEQELVLMWPDIFPSFYHFETQYLNHDMIRALSTTVTCFPLLIAALSAEIIDLVQIFESWPKWFRTQKKHVDEYYYPKGFFSDFIKFLQEILKNKKLITPNLNDIIRYHLAIGNVLFAPEDAPIVFEKFSCDVLMLIRHLVNGKPLTDEAYRPTDYFFWKSGRKLIIKRATPSLTQLLGLTTHGHHTNAKV